MIDRDAPLKVADKIKTLSCSMEDLPFGDKEYDVIWSEGAIYNIGFERGVKEWSRYLKVGGVLVKPTLDKKEMNISHSHRLVSFDG